MAQGFNVWNFVINLYTVKATHHTDTNGKILYERNAKVMNAILSSFVGSKFLKLMNFDSTKDS